MWKKQPFHPSRERRDDSSFDSPRDMSYGRSPRFGNENRPKPSQVNLALGDAESMPQTAVGGIREVTELLNNSPMRLHRILFRHNSGNPKLYSLQKLAKKNHIHVQQVEARILDAYAMPNQGVVALCNEKELLQWADVKEEFFQAKEKGEGFWKRTFGNIITEQSAEEEQKERELEEADAKKKAELKAEAKKQQDKEREEKAEVKQKIAEQKALEKAEKNEKKRLAKEEKKQKKAELAAAEVVGKINPVGATIVMVFFGVVCLSVLLGSKIFSYSSSINNAGQEFENRDYKAAYEALAGVNVSKSSEELKDKVRICMQLQRELDS